MNQNEIDVNFFAEIICSEGAVFLHQEIVEGVKWDWYLVNGKKRQICVSDEFMTKRTAKAHLRQMGLHDLIPRLFPD